MPNPATPLGDPEPEVEDAGIREIQCPYISGRAEGGGWAGCAWRTEWQEPPFSERYEATRRYRAHYQEAHMPAPIIRVVYPNELTDA